MSVKVDYDSYIRYSPAWKQKRAARLKLDRGHCRGCGSIHHLHVHHLTYDRLGHEKITDLVTVCEQCHAGIHALADRFQGRMTLAQATARYLNDRQRGIRLEKTAPARPRRPVRPRPKKDPVAEFIKAVGKKKIRKVIRSVFPHI